MRCGCCTKVDNSAFHGRKWPVPWARSEGLEPHLVIRRHRACRFPAGPMRSRRRNVITAGRGDKPATEEGDAAVAIEFDGWAVAR
jgi:hypothetical protein